MVGISVFSRWRRPFRRPRPKPTEAGATVGAFLDRQLCRSPDSAAQAIDMRSGVPQDHIVVWVGTELEQGAGAVEQGLPSRMNENPVSKPSVEAARQALVARIKCRCGDDDDLALDCAGELHALGNNSRRHGDLLVEGDRASGALTTEQEIE
jgi:hypothetical protein